MGYLVQTKLVSFVDFLVYSNLWISFSAASLVLFFYRIADLKPEWVVICFVFSATLFIYTFQRLVKLKTATAFSGGRLQWMKRNATFTYVMTFFALVVSIVLFLLLDVKSILVLIPTGFVALFYVGRFLHQKIAGLRDIPYAKAYLVALSWASVTVVLPALNAHVAALDFISALAMGIFLFIFSLAIIFDLRDAHLDEPTKRTIPQLFGNRFTLILACACISFSMLLIGFLNPVYWPVSFCTLLCAGALLLRVTRAKSDLFYSFWLDGLISLPGLLSLLF